MLYGQNLPWRAVIRQAARLGPSLTRFTTSNSYVLSRTYSISLTRRPTLLARCGHQSFASINYHSFSTSSARRKEKPGKPTQDSQEPHEEKSNELMEESKERRDAEHEAEGLGAKAKTPEPIPSSKSSNGRGASSGGSGGESGAGGGEGGGKKRKTADRSLTKPTIPEVYPQVMAIPIGKRPLFPGFYKAITIKNREVAAAISEMMKRGQPYIGAFLLKDDEADKDTIEKIGRAHV